MAFVLDVRQALTPSSDVISLDNSRMRLFASVSRLIAAVLVCIVPTACDDSPTSPSGTPAFAQTDLRLGTGAEAVVGRLVAVNYTGWLYDGSRPDEKGGQFDSSAGRDPFTFTVGVGQVIEGWDRGVPGMRVGGVRRLVIPPSLGYGNFRNGPIPPNAALVFEIELVAVAQ